MENTMSISEFNLYLNDAHTDDQADDRLAELLRKLTTLSKPEEVRSAKPLVSWVGWAF